MATKNDLPLTYLMLERGEFKKGSILKEGVPSVSAMDNKETISSKSIYCLFFI